MAISDNWSAEPEVRYSLVTLPDVFQAQARLAFPTRLNYEHAPMRLCVAQMAERFQFSYWIDRRVDADRLVTLSIPEGTVGECLSKLAEACDAECGLVENVVTIAKREHLESMQYAAVRLHNQLMFAQASGSANGEDKSTKKVNAEMRPLSWPQLTTPNELAASINETWKLTLEPKLPHDLMNAGKLQPCTVATQLTLLYGGFGQCVAGKQLSELRVLPMPPAANWQATYPATGLSGTITADRVATVKKRFPDARIEKNGDSWTVAASTEAHALLFALGRNAAPPTERPKRNTRSSNNPTQPADPLSKQRFDITKQTDKPLGAILKNLGDQLGLTIDWDTDLPPSAAQTLVTIVADKARLDDILLNLAEQAKLSITREGTRVSVGPVK